MSTNTLPMVSVCIVTYNQERFIRRCLEGVMMQQTSFAFEVIIGEDCSTDNTRSIVKEYEERYPGIIKPIYHQKNVGPQRNAYEFCWPKLTGKYIAVCEGDDYWTDPYKLQKQVDFLEKNNEFVMCFHETNTVDANDYVIRQVVVGRSNMVYEYDWRSIFRKQIATLSVVFRNRILTSHEDFVHTTYGDLFLFTVLSRYGKLAELSFNGGNYRKHGGGTYSGRTLAEKYRGAIETRKFMKRSSLFNKEQKREIDNALWREKKMFVKNLILHGEITNSLRILFA